MTPTTKRARELLLPMLAAAAGAYGVDDLEEVERGVWGTRRSNPWVQVRWAAARVLWRRHDWGVTAIGAALGRDHTTIIHGLKAGDRLIQSADPWFADALAAATRAGINRPPADELDALAYAARGNRPSSTGELIEPPRRRPAWRVPAPLAAGRS